MKNHLITYKNSWRDILVVLTAILVLGSLALVAYGIRQNNQISTRSTQHIDCIIKDLATPPPPGSSPNARKYIDIRSTLTKDCNIKFTQ